jgi:DNA processing protein
LAHQILWQGGALISEYPPGEPALKHQFVERNRLVAALGDVLLITEAAAKSGTMHTAGFALDLGRTVLAVPGNITSKTSEGTNNLLKQGAEPATDLKDILHAFGLETNAQQELSLGANPEEVLVLELLNKGVSDINALQTSSKLSAAQFNQTLTMLELTGKIHSLGGGHWAIR